VPKIFMKQFWYTIKKVQVIGEYFTEVTNDDDTLTFLIDLGYNGPLHKHTNMVLDHMHQPWRTLATIINKENVDYPELIWEDIAFQIDHMKEKRSRCKNMSFPNSPRVIDEEKVTKENVILKCGSEQESEYSKEDHRKEEEIDRINSEEDDKKKDDTDDDKIINLKMTDDKVLQEVTNVAKADAEKNSEVKDDAKKTKLSPKSSSVSVSSGFGDQFLKISSDTSLIITIKDTTDPLVLISIKETPSATHVTTIASPSVSTIPHVPLQQKTTPIPTPTITTETSTITSAVPESDALNVIQLRVAKLEKDVSGYNNIDLSAKALAALKTQVPFIVDNYLRSKVGDTPIVDLEQESKKSPSEIRKIKKERAEKQKMPSYTIKLYHALMKALIKDENTVDKGVADTVKEHKRKHDDDDDDDEDPPAGPNHGKKTKRKRTKMSESSKKPSITKETPKGKAPLKGSKTTKSASAKEQVEEPIAEVVTDDAGEDVVHNNDQPQDTSEPKTDKTLNPEWFKKPPRPPTPDLEWNKRQKLHRYGHLEEIVVKRADCKLYKFKEDDFVDLHLNEIKDIMLFAVQHKIFHLNESDIIDFIVALRMFTKSLIIKKRVEDLQLGVESYQNKLNITAPQKIFPKKRVMRADELYKFSDGILEKVQDELHHRVLDFHLGYNKEMLKRKWTAIDRKSNYGILGRYDVFVPALHKRPRRNEDQYAVSREDQYVVFKLWNMNILENIKRGPYSKKPPICRIKVSRYINSLYLGLRKKYRLSLKNDISPQDKMNDAYLTYEVEIYELANIQCELNKEDYSEQQMSHEIDDDMKGYEKVEITDDESSDSDDEDEVAKIFRIDSNAFDFETPMCRAFKEFNYLLEIDPNVLTKDIEGFKTYDKYKDDWIYEWNKDVP
nr:hypothetical protein [Tanacetum cinerariifolium]